MACRTRFSYIDVGSQKGTVVEAKKLGIPVIGVVDTNTARKAWLTSFRQRRLGSRDSLVCTRHGDARWKAALRILVNHRREEFVEWKKKATWP